MNGIIRLTMLMMSAFFAISYLALYFDVMNQSSRIIQGDLNASQELTESIKDEVISETFWVIVKSWGIMLAGALGLTGFITILKKM